MTWLNSVLFTGFSLLLANFNKEEVEAQKNLPKNIFSVCLYSFFFFSKRNITCYVPFIRCALYLYIMYIQI